MDIRELLFAPSIQEVPYGNGNSVWVKVMTGAERLAWEAVAFGADGKPVSDLWREKLLAFTLCDAGGTRLFKDDEFATLPTANGVALEEAFEVANKLNVIRKKDQDALKNS